MVFQSYAIWPHMTVKENVDFPLRHGKKKHANKQEREQAVTNALEKVHLNKFKDRPAPLLSGGQQQRVSLARAVAQSPTLILLDEPLSNLDANLREVMQKEIRSIVTDEGITAVYVTHDQKEALSMSDIIIVMSEGGIEQIGTPYEIYYQPKTQFVAEFMGAPNIIEATVIESAEPYFTVSSIMGDLHVKHREPVSVGDKLNLVIRKEDFTFDGNDIVNGKNVFKLFKCREVFLGEYTELLCGVTVAEQEISILVNSRQSLAESFEAFYCPTRIHYIKV